MTKHKSTRHGSVWPNSPTEYREWFRECFPEEPDNLPQKEINTRVNNYICEKLIQMLTKNAGGIQ